MGGRATRPSECIAVKRELAELVRRRLAAVGVLDSSLKPVLRGDEILLPVSKSNAELLEGLAQYGCKSCYAEFEVVKRRPKSVKEALQLLGVEEKLLEKAPSSFDVVGDIAVVHIPEGLELIANEIGKAILLVNPSVKVVLGEASGVEGELRLRRYVHLAGEERTVTRHRENSCVFELDLAHVYFSPRLSGERSRIVSMATRGEGVVDMFAGVGPFSVQLAKHKSCKVMAAELNEVAYSYLVKNVRLNKVEHLVTPLLGNSREVFRDYSDVADRIIMNYPAGSLNFLEDAVRLAKGRATIHVYGFTSSAEEWICNVSSRLEGLVRAEVSVRKVKEVSSRRYIFVADVKLLKG